MATVIHCDICGHHPARRASYFINREADGAGGMEDIHEFFDLCVECELSILRTLFVKQGEPNAEIVDLIKKRIAAVEKK